MNATYFSYSFGCRVNQAEKEMIDMSLTRAGFTFTEKKPSFYIINSCAVTAKAEREVRQHIYQIRKLYPNTIIIVSGCAATEWIQNSPKIRGADIVIGNNAKMTIPHLVTSMFVSYAKSDLIPVSDSGVMHADKFISSRRIFIKIADGCARFCSYCIVPYVRGKPASRSISDIVSEIYDRAKNASEVILTAINTEYFGSTNGETIPKLIDTVIRDTTVPRFSLGSIHPWSLTKDFITWYAKNRNSKRFVHFFHIPVQSGSNDVLKRMSRGYRSDALLWTLREIKRINPDSFMGTDIITGFLGETDREFNETYAFLDKAPIDRFHVFRFSNRKETISRVLKNRYQEPDEITKRHRAEALRALSRKKYARFLDSLRRKQFSALLLTDKGISTRQALLSNQVVINLQHADRIPAGSIVQCFVTQRQTNTLTGIVI